MHIQAKRFELMVKTDNKKTNDSKGFQESLVRPLTIILIFFSVIILAIFVGDIFDLESTIKIHLRYDWAMILCTFISAIAVITLSVISIVQNKRLSELNEKSLETAKINNGYSLIHFRDRQFIKQSGKQLKLKLYVIIKLILFKEKTGIKKPTKKSYTI